MYAIRSYYDLIDVNGYRIMLDCGLFQGKRKEAFELNRQGSCDAKSVDVLVLSHAHIDHSGNIPSLVKNGFAGDIYSTSATRDLCSVMLLDSAYIQEKDVIYIRITSYNVCYTKLLRVIIHECKFIDIVSIWFIDN